MSIAAMTRLAAEARVLEQRPGAESAGDDEALRRAGREPGAPGSIAGAEVTASSDHTSRAQAALEAVSNYIPAEGLAIYVAALGAFQPQVDSARWLWLAVGVVAVVLFVLFNSADLVVKPSTTQVVTLIVLATVSFVTYAAALPGSPFLSIHPQATIAAGFIAIVLSLALPRIAKFARVSPSTNA